MNWIWTVTDLFWCYTICVQICLFPFLLEGLLNLSMPQFPHLLSGGSINIHFMALFWGRNELMNSYM